MTHDKNNSQAESLRLLLVEDSANDTTLLLKELTRGGFAAEHRRVDDRVGMLDALQSTDWDVILCDYSMPGFGGLEALEIYQESGLDIPFILVSGTIGEDVAVKCMRQGAHDYLMKNRLTRLPEAIRRELREAEDRRKRKQAEDALQQQTAKLAERLKETNCLQVISQLVAKPCEQIEETLKAVVDLIPSGFACPEIVCASILFEGREFATANFRKTPWCLSTNIPLSPSRFRGPNCVFVCYLEETLVRDMGAFFKEEQQLVRSIANQLGVLIEREQAYARERHLNGVLRSIRDVNQIIVRAKLHQNLIEAACNSLASTRGFKGAWIVLTATSPDPINSVQTGFADCAFDRLRQQIQEGNLPACCVQARAENRVTAIQDPCATCGDCPLRETYDEGNAAMTVSLTYEDRAYGWIGVTVPPEFALDDEEASLLTEIASDIAFTLHGIEVEKDRKEMEKQLHQELGRRQDLERIINLSPVTVWLWRNKEGWPVDFVSDNVCLLGYKPEDFYTGQVPFSSIVHPDDLARVSAEIAMHSKDTECQSFTQEYRILTADKQVRNVDDRTWIQRSDHGDITHYHGILVDITVRKRLEQDRLAMEAQLIQSQKLEAVGTLASGVAHEINNPIMGIMNYAQLIQDGMAIESPLREYANEIMVETDRVATIVKNLLGFAREDQQTDSNPARIVDIVNGVLSLIDTVMRHDQITLSVEIPEDLPPLTCRDQQIQQVLMNLLTNARDALNEKYPGHDQDKVIHITAELGSPPVALAKKGTRNSEFRTSLSRIRLTIEDHGGGIPPEIRERMFDPFFTTKPRDKGTGLGLSISHGIIKEHGGELSVESESGQWTRFYIDLPIGGGE